MSPRAQLSERFNLWAFVTLLAWRGGLEWWWLVALFIQCGFALVALVAEVFYKLEAERCRCGAERSDEDPRLRGSVAASGYRVFITRLLAGREEPIDLRACKCGAIYVRRDEHHE